MMTNTVKKFLFLGVVLAGVLFACLAYPNVIGIPFVLGTADQSATGDVHAQTPPTLVLPQTSVKSPDQTFNNNGGETGVTGGSATSSVFAKIGSAPVPAFS